MKADLKFLKGLLTPTVLGGIGFFSGLYLIVFQNPKTLSASFTHMMSEPEIAVWCLLITGQVALWFGYAFPVGKKIYEYFISAKILSWELVGTFFIIAVLCVFFLSAHGTTSISKLENFPIDSPEIYAIKVIILDVVGIIIVVSTLFGGYAVGQAFKGLTASAPADPGNDSVKKYLKYKEDLQWFLQAAGLMVGGATLATGALHRALSVLNKYQPKPLEILLYGAYISGVVALIFIPAIVKSHAAGRAVREKLLPFPEKELGGEEWIKWSENRSKLDAMLGLNKDILDNLKVGLAIVTPIVTSALSLFLGKP